MITRAGQFAGIIALLSIVGAAVAGPIFVGSWEVDDGPFWTDAPPVYSGQEAAALLFGGSPSDYSISTTGTDPNLIDHLAWVSEIFVGGGHTVAESASSGGTNGLYDEAGDFSTYVEDNAIGSNFTNYAFRNDAAAAVPEPSTLIVWGVAFLATAGYGWRRRLKSATA